MDGPTRVELEAVEVRIREIRRELPRLGGPIAVTVLGAVVATIPAALGLLYTAVTYPPSGASARNLLLGLGAGTLVGSGIAAGGLVWLGRRSRERRAYKPELDALKHRRKQLHELRWGPNVQSHHYGLALTARF